MSLVCWKVPINKLPFSTVVNLCFSLYCILLAFLFVFTDIYYLYEVIKNNFFYVIYFVFSYLSWFVYYFYHNVFIKSFLVLHGERLNGNSPWTGERMAVQICFGRKTNCLQWWSHWFLYILQLMWVTVSHSCLLEHMKFYMKILIRKNVMISLNWKKSFYF